MNGLHISISRPRLRDPTRQSAAQNSSGKLTGKMIATSRNTLIALAVCLVTFSITVIQGVYVLTKQTVDDMHMHCSARSLA